MSVQIRNVILLVLLRAPGVAGQECEILNNPNAENVAELGLSWCPSDVSFQVRAFALQAARAQCAVTTSRPSTPEQIQARKQETRTACEILAGLDVSNCRCPPGLVTPLLRRPVVPLVPASRLPEDFHSKAAQMDAQSCQGQPKGVSCWMELSNQPGCYVWNPYLQLDETVTWAGVCAEGWAQGKGTLKWVGDGGQETAEDTGRLQAGKRHGRWVQRTANGSVQEGPYVEGKRHGVWVWRGPAGAVFEGPYVEGKRHGKWVLRAADGSVQEGPYAEGKRHGKWVLRGANGIVQEGPYVQGKRHGRWVLRDAYENVAEGSYVEGKAPGRVDLRSRAGRIVGSVVFQGSE